MARAHYRVLVGDGLAGRPGDAYQLGTFDDRSTALAACMELVESFLVAQLVPGMSAEELFRAFADWGEEPRIEPVGPAEACEFSASLYARRRCAALCGASRSS